MASVRGHLGVVTMLLKSRADLSTVEEVPTDTQHTDEWTLKGGLGCFLQQVVHTCFDVSRKNSYLVLYDYSVDLQPCFISSNVV